MFWRKSAKEINCIFVDKIIKKGNLSILITPCAWSAKDISLSIMTQMYRIYPLPIRRMGWFWLKYYVDLSFCGKCQPVLHSAGPEGTRRDNSICQIEFKQISIWKPNENSVDTFDDLRLIRMMYFVPEFSESTRKIHWKNYILIWILFKWIIYKSFLF